MAKDIEVAGHGDLTLKDYHDPPPAPLVDPEELGSWSFYRAIIAEFVATLLFLYVTVLTVIGYKNQTDPYHHGNECNGVGILGIAWAFGGMIFILVYCTAGISGELSLSLSVWLTGKQRKIWNSSSTFSTTMIIILLTYCGCSCYNAQEGILILQWRSGYSWLERCRWSEPWCTWWPSAGEPSAAVAWSSYSRIFTTSDTVVAPMSSPLDTV